MDLNKLFLGDALADVQELENGDISGLEKIGGLDFITDKSHPVSDLLHSNSDSDS